MAIQEPLYLWKKDPVRISLRGKETEDFLVNCYIIPLNNQGETEIKN